MAHFDYRMPILEEPRLHTVNTNLYYDFDGSLTGHCGCFYLNISCLDERVDKYSVQVYEEGTGIIIASCPIIEGNKFIFYGATTPIPCNQLDSVRVQAQFFERGQVPAINILPPEPDQPKTYSAYIDEKLYIDFSLGGEFIDSITHIAKGHYKLNWASLFKDTPQVHIFSTNGSVVYKDINPFYVEFQNYSINMGGLENAAFSVQVIEIPRHKNGDFKVDPDSGEGKVWVDGRWVDFAIPSTASAYNPVHSTSKSPADIEREIFDSVYNRVSQNFKKEQDKFKKKVEAQVTVLKKENMKLIVDKNKLELEKYQRELPKRSGWSRKSDYASREFMLIDEERVWQSLKIEMTIKK